jgi:hypothetical protein
MCANCAKAVRVLMRHGFKREDAMGFLWEMTPFPFASGEMILTRVRQLLKRRASRPQRERGRRP